MTNWYRRWKRDDRGWPKYLPGGRMRTSTAAMLLAFLALALVHESYQPPPAAAPESAQVVPPGFMPDPQYTWVPRTNVRTQPRTTTPTTTTTTETSPTTPTETTETSPTGPSDSTSPTTPTTSGPAPTTLVDPDGAGPLPPTTVTTTSPTTVPNRSGTPTTVPTTTAVPGAGAGASTTAPPQ